MRHAGGPVIGLMDGELRGTGRLFPGDSQPPWASRLYCIGPAFTAFFFMALALQ